VVTKTILHKSVSKPAGPCPEVNTRLVHPTILHIPGNTLSASHLTRRMICAAEMPLKYMVKAAYTLTTLLKVALLLLLVPEGASGKAAIRS